VLTVSVGRVFGLVQVTEMEKRGLSFDGATVSGRDEGSYTACNRVVYDLMTEAKEVVSGAGSSSLSQVATEDLRVRCLVVVVGVVGMVAGVVAGGTESMRLAAGGSRREGENRH
jgi:hypothetical protein